MTLFIVFRRVAVCISTDILLWILVICDKNSTQTVDQPMVGGGVEGKLNEISSVPSVIWMPIDTWEIVTLTLQLFVQEKVRRLRSVYTFRRHRCRFQRLHCVNGDARSGFQTHSDHQTARHHWHNFTVPDSQEMGAERISSTIAIAKDAPLS